MFSRCVYRIAKFYEQLQNFAILPYTKVVYEGLFNFENGSQNDICPYIIWDKGYFFLPWLMTP
jgi:hypothetical protein